MKYFTLGGVLGPALFSVMVVICGALRPGYSHVEEFISALGAQGSTHAALMNYGGFVPSGILIAVFGLSLLGVMPRRFSSMAIAILVAAFGVGVAMAGLYSCDPGCSQPPVTRAGIIHDRVSPMAFLSMLMAMTISSVGFRRVTAFRSLWAFSSLSSLAALVFFVGLVVSFESGGPVGLWQRLFLGTVFTWCAVVALRHSSHEWSGSGPIANRGGAQPPIHPTTGTHDPR
jgi:hypothetical membrane protein